MGKERCFVYQNGYLAPIKSPIPEEPSDLEEAIRELGFQRCELLGYANPMGSSWTQLYSQIGGRAPFVYDFRVDITIGHSCWEVWIPGLGELLQFALFIEPLMRLLGEGARREEFNPGIGS